MGTTASERFERWKARRAEREAGQVFDARPDVGADLTEGEGVGDEAAYAAFRSELSGETGRQRAVEAERQHQRERESKAIEEARLYGRPLAADTEHLRPQLLEYGY